MIDNRLALLTQGPDLASAGNNALNAFLGVQQNQRRNKLLDLNQQRTEFDQGLQRERMDLAQEQHDQSKKKEQLTVLGYMAQGLAKLPKEQRAAAKEQYKQMYLPVYGEEGVARFDNLPEDDETLAQMLSGLKAYLPQASAKLHKIGEGDKLVDGAGNVVADNPKAPDQTKGFGQEGKLRGEYTSFSKDFQKQNAAFGRIQAAANDPSPAGDLALIFNYMKLLDPGSTVREGEFATAQGAMAALDTAKEEGAIVPNFVMSYVKQLTEGTRLLPEQRQDFYGRSQMLFADAKEQNDRLAQRYTNLATGYGLDPTRVVIDMQTADPDKPVNLGGASVPPSLPEGTQANPDGTFTLPDGRVVRAKSE